MANSSEEPRSAATEKEEDGQASHFVVGVGASSGGLEAFTDLLQHLPADTGLAFVLIQHLDPTHDSHLAELLSKVSAMPVTEVAAGETLVVANHVYVIPPRYNLDISAGALHTMPRPENGSNLPIDAFFSALAADCGTGAVGVVLSGNATDGTLGLRAIKAAGGITFAQDELTAKYNGMPSSAIAAGVVDFVLPPSGIASRLTALGRDAATGGKHSKTPDKPIDDDLSEILRLVRSVTGVDFTHYKQTTLRRRIKRRMAIRGFETLEDYIRDLERHREEASALCESCFVTVTAFFREPAVLDELKDRVFPALVKNRGVGDPIRVWVPGCSTGEEAYSIAICLTEFLEQAGARLSFEVFATDVSDTAIARARVGAYSEASVAHVSSPRMTRFFTKTDRGYQIVRAIRDACVFATHNVARDPPFSRMDLVSCCNVLIYLGADLQRRVLSTLHHSLKPTGFLVLGPSESIGAFEGSFQPLEKGHKVYSVRPSASVAIGVVNEPRRVPGRAEIREKSAEGQATLDVQKEADRLVLADHGPPGVIVDDRLNIVQVRGKTAPYLELSPGEPTRNLLKMTREGLIVGLGKAIQTARETNAVAEEAGFRIEPDGQLKDVAIKVFPVGDASTSASRYFLVLFSDTELEANAPPRENNDGDRLRRELAATREYLQSVVTDKATTLDDLRAAHDEAQAGNEELETAQEELESANEELNTLNEDLKSGNTELKHVNRDLTNLLESISIPLVMVGRDLRIRRFTHAVQPMLNLIASDVGRSITDLKPLMELPDLRRLLVDAMDDRDRTPHDIRDSHGRWYSLRIQPSMGANGSIDGAVLMLIDIDAAKRGLDFAEAIVETVREPLVILNQKLQVIQANRSFYETFHAVREETEQRLIYDLGNGQWNIPKLRELLENILPAHSTFRDFEVTHEFEHVGKKVMLLNGSEIFNPTAQARTILLAIEDVTDRKQSEAALRASNGELQDFAYALTHDLQEPLRMVVNFTELLGRTYKEKLGEEGDKLISYSIDGALRIEALLKALLVYWEVTERGQNRFTTVDCNAVLGMALSHLHSAIELSGAVITSDPLPTLVAEEFVVLQVFQNLIGNSIKYKAEDPPRVHVSARRDGNSWVFAVQDNGIGIEPQDAERVFGMFKRLHGAEIPGTGIGLALCKKIVERQGGRIWLDPQTGPGSTFKFTIPASHKERILQREA